MLKLTINSIIKEAIPSVFPLKKLSAWQVTKTEANIKAPVKQNTKNSKKDLKSNPLIIRNKIILMCKTT